MNTEVIYNKIIFYYDIIDKIKEEILKLKKLEEGEKFQTLMPIVDELKETVDKMMEKYVIFSKDSSNEVVKNEILEILNEILEIISNYKGLIYSLYQK